MSLPPGTPDPDAPRDPWAQPGWGPVGGYPPPPPGGPWAGPPPYGGVRTNGKAQGALASGIGLLVLTFCCLAGVLGFVPVILGVQARREIARSGGREVGDGMALAGIVTGALALVVSVLLLVLVLVVLAHASGAYRTGVEGTDV